jgi:predicted ATP-dependent protease
MCFWIAFAVCVNVLSLSLLPDTPREATSFFESIAVAVDKAQQLPEATRSAIARLVDERHYRRDRPYSDPVLEARQMAAVERIEASLNRSASLAGLH